MRIAIATCRDLPEWEVDDHPFHAALLDRGVGFERPAWDDPCVNWADFDAVLIRTTWDYMERVDEFVAWAERVAGTTRLFNPLPVVQWNTRKTYLRELEAAGVRIAPTEWLDKDQPVDVPDLLQRRGWTRAFIKPVVGATARETLRFASDATGLEAANQHLRRTLARESMMMQPYLEAVETEGELSALFFDGRLSHGVRKVPVDGDYRVQDDFGAHDEPHRFTDAEVELATGIVRTARAHLELDEPLLYARVDFLRDPDGTLLLNELELVEPSLFFRHDPDSPARLAQALLRRLEGGGAA